MSDALEQRELWIGHRGRRCVVERRDGHADQRMPFGTGNSGSRSAWANHSTSSDPVNGPGTVRLRVTAWKSAYFTFSVIVRALSCLASQWRRTFATRGVSSDCAASRSTMSVAKVASAPIDFRTRSGSTGRSSIPRRSDSTSSPTSRNAPAGRLAASPIDRRRSGFLASPSWRRLPARRNGTSFRPTPRRRRARRAARCRPSSGQ